MKRITGITALVLAAVMIAAVFTGCSKVPARTSDFVKLCGEKGLTVEDASDIYTSDIFTDAQLATSPDGWQIVFLTVDTAEHAEEYFGTCKEYMENQKTGAGTAQTSYGSGYNIYWQVNGGRYMYGGQVGATFLFADEDESFRSAIEEFVKALGY